MIINLYSANSMWHVQTCFTISIHEIEPKALKAPLAAAIRFMYGSLIISEYGTYGRGRITAPGRFPYSFWERVRLEEAELDGVLDTGATHPTWGLNLFARYCTSAGEVPSVTSAVCYSYCPKEMQTIYGASEILDWETFSWGSTMIIIV